MKLKPIVTRTIRICRGVTTLPFALPLRSDRNSHFGVSPDGVVFSDCSERIVVLIGPIFHLRMAVG